MNYWNTKPSNLLRVHYSLLGRLKEKCYLRKTAILITCIKASHSLADLERREGGREREGEEEGEGEKDRERGEVERGG